jgi:phage gp36-like protein
MYLQGRYATPLTPVTPAVSDICNKLTVYFLYKRVLTMELPEAVVLDYKDSIRILKEVQEGKMKLLPENEDPTWYLVSSQGQTAYSPSLQQVTNNWSKYFI